MAYAADSAVRYGRVTQVLHWAMALLVLLQFGKFADYFAIALLHQFMLRDDTIKTDDRLTVCSAGE